MVPCNDKKNAVDDNVLVILAASLLVNKLVVNAAVALPSFRLLHDSRVYLFRCCDVTFAFAGAMRAC